MENLLISRRYFRDAVRHKLRDSFGPSSLTFHAGELACELLFAKVMARSLSQLADDFDLSLSSMRRVLRKLQAIGMISINRCCRETGAQAANLYQINRDAGLRLLAVYLWQKAVAVEQADQSIESELSQEWLLLSTEMEEAGFKDAAKFLVIARELGFGPDELFEMLKNADP